MVVPVEYSPCNSGQYASSHWLFISSRVLRDRVTSLDKTDENKDYRYDEQDVDEASNRIRSNEAECPEHE